MAKVKYPASKYDLWVEPDAGIREAWCFMGREFGTQSPFIIERGLTKEKAERRLADALKTKGPVK